MYYQADFVYDGALPVHVTFMLDEFANVKLPENFLSLLSTMRSRNISSVIIIQNMAQIKKMYKNEEHESIPANCSTTVYLGNDEQTTHEWISKQIGNETIDKRSSSESKGKNGSFSNSNDVMQRALMYPDEVRKKPRGKCIVLISGEDPIYDDKFKTWKHPMWKEFNRLSKKYKFDARVERAGKRNGIIKIKGRAEMMEVKLYESDEVDMLREVDARNLTEYNEDCKIAELTGDMKPVKPAERVMDVSLQELMWLLENERIESTDAFEDELVTDEDIEERILDELADIVMDEENEAYYDVVDSTEDTFGGGEAENKEESFVIEKDRHAEYLIGLRQAGFSPEQIEVMVPEMDKIENCTIKYICSLISPDYDTETIKFMLNMLH